MNPHPFRFPAGAVAPAIVALAGLTCEPAAGIQVDSAIIVLDPGAHETGMKATSELRT